MSKERPILFNSEMVRAILDGYKTQTRRIMKDQPEPKPLDVFPEGGFWFPTGCDRWGFMADIKDQGPWVCPYGEKGDRLWVRENFRLSTGLQHDHNGVVTYVDDKTKLVYWQDGHKIHARYGFIEKGSKESQRLRPSIHMPRWASRITLEITDVRVERLNEISEEESFLEGFKDSEDFTSKGAFKKTWNSIYKNWSENPWVWVIEFKQIKESK